MAVGASLRHTPPPVSPRHVFLVVTCAAALVLADLRAWSFADGELWEDSRLSQRVTIHGARLYIAEVAEDLSRQTGVAIDADEATGASDVSLLVSVDKLPAWKVMDAIAGLMGYNLAPWRWEQTGEASASGYRLIQTRAARGLAFTLQDESQRAFEADLATRLEAARMSSGECAARLADPTPMSLQELRPLGVRLVDECVPPEVRPSLLRGEMTYDLPVAGLPGWAQRFVDDTYQTVELYRLLPDGSRQRIPPPRSVRVSADRLGADATRTLWLHLEGIGARDYAGGPRLERQFLAKLQQRWLSASDRRSDAKAEAIVLRDPEPTAQQSPPLPFLHGVLMQASQRSGVPILARLPDDRTTLPDGLSAEPGTTLGRYLAALDRSYPYLARKWRNDILLVGYHSWFVREEELHRPPWRVVRQLREAATKNDGMVPLTELVAAATDLAPEQLGALGMVWPNARGLLAIRDVLVCVRRNADALKSLTTNGRTTLYGAGARLSAAGYLSGSAVLDRVDRVALTATESGSGVTRSLDVTVVASDRLGAELGRMGVRFVAGTP